MKKVQYEAEILYCRLRTLGKSHNQLIEEARRRFGAISPCGSAADFRECFNKVNGRLIFWFNSCDGSTHIVKSQYTRLKPRAMSAQSCA